VHCVVLLFWLTQQHILGVGYCGRGALAALATSGRLKASRRSLTCVTGDYVPLTTGSAFVANAKRAMPIAAAI
jgi:hypothetical protein